MEKIIKKIIIIKGKKVQDVGYRLFLLDLADSESVPYLNAKNKEDIDEDSNEIVEVFVGGEEKQINNLVESIQDFENNKPKKAIVKSIEVVDNDYKGSIRTTESFSRWLSNNQLFKIAEAGTIMISKQDIMIYKQDQMIGKQDETIQEIRDMRKEIVGKQDQMLGKQDQMLGKQDETIQEIKDMRKEIVGRQDQMLGKQDKTIQEIKYLREDLKPIPYIDIRTEKLEKDTFEIKKKLKIVEM